jgi:hypothetical protein
MDDDAFAFLRDTEKEQVVIVAHRGPGTRPASSLHVSPAGIPDGTVLTEYLSGGTATVQAGHLPIPSLTPGIQLWFARGPGQNG